MDKKRAIQIIKDYQSLERSILNAVPDTEHYTRLISINDSTGEIQINHGWFDFSHNEEVPTYIIEENC